MCKRNQYGDYINEVLIPNTYIRFYYSWRYQYVFSKVYLEHIFNYLSNAYTSNGI